MSYTPTYESADLVPIVFDFVGQVLAGLASNGTIIVGLIILALILELTTGVITKMFGGLLGSLKRK